VDSAAGATRSIATRRKASRFSISRAARRGVVGVSVTRVNTRHASQGARRASFPPVLEPVRQCPRRRRRTSEIGDVHGEGCPSRRGAGGPSREAPRGADPRRATTRVSRVDAKATHAIEWAVDRSIEAGRCEQLGHPARQARTTRMVEGREIGHSRRNERCSDHVMCTHDDMKTVKGLRVRS